MTEPKKYLKVVEVERREEDLASAILTKITYPPN
jgi:hypothetical protein